MSSTLVLSQSETVQHNSVEDEVEVENKAPRLAELYEFNNCSRGLGIKICGGCSQDGEELNAVFIKRILPGGLAETQGGLQRGDQILEVNGDSLEGVTNDRAVSILRLACASNHVEIVVVRDEEARLEFEEILEKEAMRSISGTPVPTEQRGLVRKTSSAQSDNGSTSNQLGTNAASAEEEMQVTPEPEAVPPSYVTPKLPFRNLIPSMASTPHAKGSTATSGSRSSGSRFSSLPPVAPSPVNGPVMSLMKSQNMTDSSVFEPSLTAPSPAKQRNTSLTRKLSIDPHARLKVEKLNSALRYLRLDYTPEKEFLMRSKLNIDSKGTVHYGEFVEVVKEVFKLELEQQNIGTSTIMFAANNITDLVDHPAFTTEMTCGASGVTPPPLEVENEELRQENMRLQVLLGEKEDELLRIRKEAQGAIQEQRELRSKVHLAAKAQRVARDMEHDYEEVVRLLEGEIAQLKLQQSRQADSDPIMQRRLAVLTCQLKKSESEKETFKVATEKLLQFAETVYETFGENQNGAVSRPLAGAKSTGLLGKHKRTADSSKTIAAEAKDIVKSVRSLIDTQPLPFGWEETYSPDGIKYYINHLTQVTTWTHPLSNVTHLPTVPDDQKPTDTEPKPAGSTEC